MGSTRATIDAANAKVLQTQRDQIAKQIAPRYALGALLGQGGFAWVWRVFDRATGLALAMKQLASTDPRFYRELRSLFRVDHENVVRVVNLLEASEQSRYLFLELCLGGSLRQAMYAGRAEAPRVALAVLEQIARGLGAIHGQGIVHRDLKPANILLNRGDDLGAAHVKVTDFGLVQFARERSSETLEGGVSGSPSYMAPEQFAGDACFASDLYALGVIAFELLTGGVPFTGSVLDIARQHTHAEPSWGALPAQVRPLLQRLLDKDPDRRGTASEAAHELGMLHASTAPTLKVEPTLANPWETTQLNAADEGAFQVATTCESTFVQVSTRGFSRLTLDGHPVTRVALPDLRAAVEDPNGTALWLLRGSDVWLAQNDATPAFSPIVPLPRPVDDLAGWLGIAPRETRIACVEGEFLRELSVDAPNQPVWSREVGEGTRLARLADGSVVLAQREPRPTLSVVNYDGRTELELDLPGPPARVFAWADSVAALVTTGGASSLHWVDPKTSTLRNCGSFLQRVSHLTLDSADRVIALGANGHVVRWTSPNTASETLGRIVFPGRPLSVSAVGDTLVLLTATETSGWIARKRLHALGEASE